MRIRRPRCSSRRSSCRRVSMTPVSSPSLQDILHCVQTKHSQLVRYNLDKEPPTPIKRMSLRFRHNPPPYLLIILRPPIRPLNKDIMRQNVVIPKRRHNRYPELLQARPVIAFASPKHLFELVHQHAVLAQHLRFRSRDLLVVVVARRVARPDYKVDFVGEVLGDPGEGCVDEGQGGVAVAGFGAVVACCAMAAVTGEAGFGGGVRFVEGVGVDVFGGPSLVAVQRHGRPQGLQTCYL